MKLLSIQSIAVAAESYDNQHTQVTKPCAATTSPTAHRRGPNNHSSPTVSKAMAAVTPLFPDIPLPLLLAVFFGSISALFFLRSRSRSSSSPNPALPPLPPPNPPRASKQHPPNMTTSNDPPATQLTLTPAQLAQFNNADASLPVYVAIKGIIYDVSSNREMYPCGQSYGLFAGKDASRALAKSSLDEKHIRADWQDLPEEEIKVLDDWVKFYEKKYPKVGRVVAE
ncbi:cytochrome b5-like heme/steroid binding domain-containing protein [Catenaria anguillulae PL171]|uniref:Cytochrome b5-like heme/steroid binding domain-containing protein n=1 Tax=Catenaria anguillulae PL171 TaxID=765915 RepID=A0A1Y2HVX0_9FUNG|nr:cytochrome b5-like heme/steroid binding domain-containing protein [Catenaria anguillulae PL171]